MRLFELLQHQEALLEFGSHRLALLIELLPLPFELIHPRLHLLLLFVVFLLILLLGLGLIGQLLDELAYLGFVFHAEVLQSSIRAGSHWLGGLDIVLWLSISRLSSSLRHLRLLR